MNFLANFFSNLYGSLNYEFSYFYLLPIVVLLPTLVFLYLVYNKPVVPPKIVRKNILIVDDSLVVRVKLQKLLSGTYYTSEARNGLEALKHLDSERVDLIITDLEMPGMDGFELISHVTGSLETENIPIIAITSHESLSAKVNQLGGVYGIFNKPWNDRELLRRIGSLVELKK